ncbi:hypothetical protein NQ318_007006 [Aromia moschata]|uniref:Uncharacterized protein n=1 Tax=Aromia moschata TaxID=1265417 RepID=A0AAV8XH77_9CUCU|nr:hypothetical protein NQ318_007006 [Aromia moschata]
MSLQVNLKHEPSSNAMTCIRDKWTPHAAFYRDGTREGGDLTGTVSRPNRGKRGEITEDVN